jgi:hypothetical protein
MGHLENAPVERFQNAPEPVAQPVARLQQLADCPGVHRRLRAAATHKARLTVAQVARVRAFAKAEGLHGPARRAAVGALYAPGGG